MLPLLQDWGVGRRTIIIVALMIAVVQWLTMASLSLPAVQRLSLSYYIPYDDHEISGASVFAETGIDSQSWID